MDEKDRGLYAGGGGQYTGGGGQYTGSGGQYAGDSGDGGKYYHIDDGNRGKNEGTKNTGSRVGYNIPTEIQIGGRNNLTPPATTRTNLTPPATTRTTGPAIIGIAPASKTSYPNSANSGSGWKIIRQEQSEDSDGYHYL